MPPIGRDPKEVPPEGECEDVGFSTWLYILMLVSPGLYPVVRLVTGSLPGHEVYHGIGPHASVSIPSLAWLKK